ncbi:MAG: carbonic anhydrase [Burkholderiales bacterium]|nr:carbonic anhydrase [Burkholderiales bacterium]
MVNFYKLNNALMLKHKIIFFGLGLLLLYSVNLSADASSLVSKTEKEQLREIVRHVLESNEVFVERLPKDYFKDLIHGQKPIATMVTCADSRLHTHALDIHPDGDIFLVRNIGNQVTTSEGSIEYGVRHLHTPVLFIIGHSSCGAVEAAMSRPSNLEPSIWRELETIKVAGNRADDHVEVKVSVETNVHHQVASALKKYEKEVEDGHLTVFGGVYDFRNDYGRGSGRLVIINVNGETNPFEIEKMRLYDFKKSSNKHEQNKGLVTVHH